VEEAELALVVVGERKLVVARALGEEAAAELGAAAVPTVSRILVAAALVLDTARAERREMLGRHHPSVGRAEALLLDAVRVRVPAEVVVERPVLHHQDHEVVDLHVPPARHVRAAVRGLGGLREDGAGGQAGGHPGESRAVCRALEEVAA
jgi:hypothetical protein